MSPATYWEEAPSAALAGVVARVSYSVDAGPPYGPVRVLPDGCTDLLFSAPRDGGEATLAVYGVKTRALLVDNREPLAQLAVQLCPGAAARVLGVAASELCDAALPLAELWGRRARELAEEVQGAASWRTRRAALETALVEALARSRRRSGVEPAVDAAVAALRRSGGRLRIRALCAELGVGERRLERAFLTHVGLTPKALARTLRFQRANAQLRAGRPAAATALCCGYADQAHLSREFRELAGTTPARWRGDA